MQKAFVGTPLPAFRPATSRPRSTTRSVKTQALFGLKTKKEDAADDDFVGFRYDPSMQRWIRAPNAKPNKAVMTVTPLSGSPYTVWPVMHTYLTSKKLKSVDQDQALALMKKGAVLIDVRLGEDYVKEHADKSISVPLFRITAGDETWDKIKRVVMAGLAMRPTERDPDFVKNVEKAVGNKRKKLILMCTIGGTLDTVVRVASTGKKTETDKDRSFGRESRSLKACYELMKAGFTDVVHLKGGLGDWRHLGYPMADDE